MIEHPYIRYAVALIMGKHNYHSCDEITTQNIVDELTICRAEFSLRLQETLAKKDYIDYGYSDKEPNWGKRLVESEENVVVSPHIISSDINGLYSELSSIIVNLENRPSSKGDVKKCIFPIGGEYLRFSESGSVGKSNAKLKNTDIALMAITTLTSKKPSCSVWTKKGKVKTCVIPDLSLPATQDFVFIFDRLEKQKSDGLFKGRIDQKGKKLKANLPLLCWGNYSGASKSSYFQALSVLGYIGLLSKEKDYSSKAKSVIEELYKNPLLLITLTPKSESAEIIMFNHFIIEIALNSALNKIIDSLYDIKFYKFKGLKRTDSILFYKDKGIKIEEKDIEYEKFDYYVSKFLTLFNNCTFNEFLSCRVEYPSEIRTIFTIYFNNMEQISKDVIASAEAFGAWINRCSFIAAKNDSFPNIKWEELAENEKQKIVEKKYKFLVELESSVFSSDNNRSMISNIITRVGRLSNTDVPQEATLFVKAVVEPSIDIGTAKNLVIAFSRIHSKGDNYKQTGNNPETKTSETIDSSNI